MKLPIYAIVAITDGALIRTTSGFVFTSPSRILLEQVLEDDSRLGFNPGAHWEVKLIEEVELTENV